MGKAIGALGAALVLASAAWATTLKRVTLDDLAERSREIVVGTVQATEHVPGEDERAFVFTEVTLGKLDVWSGAVAGSTARYRFVGGTRGERTLTVPGVPKLAKGARVVLFVDGDDDLCPLVGWTQGCFRVVVDERTGNETVTTADGHAVYGFDSGLPVREPTKERPRPLSLVELKVEVVRALDAAEARRRAAAEEPAPRTDEDAPSRDTPPAPERREEAR
jgi:hypothetical protein